MKKLLLIISTVVLTTASINPLINSLVSKSLYQTDDKKDNDLFKFFENNKKQNINNEKNIDFNEVENYFKDEKNKKNVKYNGLISNNFFKNKSQIDNAFAKALEYTKQFKEKNMSLQEIITKFRNEIPRFKTVYDRAKSNFLEKNKETIRNINNINFVNKFKKNIKGPDEDKLKIEALEFWNKLNIIKTAFITTAAISAILAAGFWIAAWFGGISIPWAVAATITSVTCSAAAQGINIYLVTNNPIIDKINKNLEIGINVGALCYAFFRNLYGIIQFSLVTVGTTSVITATAAAIFAVGIAFYIWIINTNIFSQVENSQNEEIKKWVKDAQNGIVRKYKFDFKRIGYSTNGETNDQKNVTSRKWTDYASSVEEFKQVFKYLIFQDSLAQVGGQGSTVKKENFLIKTSDLTDNPNKKRIVWLANYNYTLLFTKQKADISVIPFCENDYLDFQFRFYTYSHLAVNDVWAQVRFNDIYFVI